MSSQSAFNVEVYFPEWGIYQRNYFVKDAAPFMDKGCGLSYAFLTIKKNANGLYVPTLYDPWADTDVRFTEANKSLPPVDTWYPEPPPGTYFGNFGQLKRYIESNPNAKISMSIGGWTLSKHFSDMVNGDQQREAASNEIISLLTKYTFFNGIDLDWEYLSPPGQSYGLEGNISRAEDPENFVLFLTLLRQKLNANSKFKDYKITTAVTANTKKMDYLPVEKMLPFIDMWRLMTYDFSSGAWGETVTRLHSNVYSTPNTNFSIDTAVKEYLKRGVDPKKIGIGCCTYSRGFANTDGLGKTGSGSSTDYSWEAGVMDYKKIADLQGFVEGFDQESKGAFAYNASKREFISYDNVQSIKEKCKYARDNGLGCVFFWEFSGDYAYGDPRSLITTALNESKILKQTTQTSGTTGSSGSSGTINNQNNNSTGYTGVTGPTGPIGSTGNTNTQNNGATGFSGSSGSNTTTNNQNNGTNVSPPNITNITNVFQFPSKFSVHGELWIENDKLNYTANFSLEN